jgi:hypothetical protein
MNPAQNMTHSLSESAAWPGYTEHEASFACSAQTLFDHITNASLWHTWHPATRSVRDVPQRPLVKGDTVLESITAAGRQFDAVWTVEECAPQATPMRWTITTRTERGAARLTYEITPTQGGCRFTRKLWFRSFKAPWRWLDKTLVRRMLSRQTAQALVNLQRVMERVAEQQAKH